MQADLKHRQIFRELSNEIADGKYRESGRLPSENQLVKRFGVSRPTVARALRDLQAAGLIERRAGAGSFLVDNPVGVPKAPDHHLLALLIPRAGLTEIFEVICGELAGLARAKNCSLIWGGSGVHVRPENDISVEDVDHICEEFIDRAVNGVFFAPFELRENTAPISERIAQRLRQAGIAVVLLDRDFQSFPQRSDFDLVGLDNYAAGFLLAEHLIRLGQTRLTFVARPFSACTITARIAGAKEALARAGIPIPEGFARFGDPEDTAFVRNLVAGKSVDGILCGNDATAVQLLNTLAKIKVRVPEDIRVVGCDDVRYAKLVREPLTTINQPCRAIAVAAMTAMLERIADPTLPARSILLNPKLTVRSSCGAYLH